MSERLVDVVTGVLTAVAARGDTITYTDLLAGLGAIDTGLAAEAEHDLAAVLRTVSVASDEAGWGLLTAVVVRRPGGLPGGGYFRLASERGRDVSDLRTAWEAELERVQTARSGRGDGDRPV